MLVEMASADTWVIPSVGPDYGKMMDQFPVVRDMGFPTVMVLPLGFPATPSGVETEIRRFVESFGKPIILYIKFEGYLEPEGVKRLVDEGLVYGIKYAIVRKDPTVDDYLTKLLGLIDRRYVISGIGERPAVTHLRDFGLNGFTSGSVCIAPNRSTQILRALKVGDHATAEAIRTRILPFEDLREAISPVRVLHDGVTLAGIAEMGQIFPLMSSLSPAEAETVAPAARDLLAYDREAEGARLSA
jgi:dihydrodipicolinate synthase/N-acetylneuraminate lyase